MRVAIIMGSAGDIDIAKSAADTLKEFDIPYDARVLSAHRSPAELAAFVNEDRHDVYIAIAGMAAHLAGAVAANTYKPVIAVPVKSNCLEGLDALLSSVMMPPGVPAATVAINGGKNAGLLAAQILGTGGGVTAEKLKLYKEEIRRKSLESDKTIDL